MPVRNSMPYRKFCVHAITTTNQEQIEWRRRGRRFAPQVSRSTHLTRARQVRLDLKAGLILLYKHLGCRFKYRRFLVNYLIQNCINLTIIISSFPHCYRLSLFYLLLHVFLLLHLQYILVIPFVKEIASFRLIVRIMEARYRYY